MKHLILISFNFDGKRLEGFEIIQIIYCLKDVPFVIDIKIVCIIFLFFLNDEAFEFGGRVSVRHLDVFKTSINQKNANDYKYNNQF